MPATGCQRNPAHFAQRGAITRKQLSATDPDPTGYGGRLIKRDFAEGARGVLRRILRQDLRPVDVAARLVVRSDR